MAEHTIEDYKHYYEGCFGINSQGTIVYVESIEATPKKHVFALRGTAAIQNAWYPFKGLSSEVTYPMPQMGYVNVYDSSVLIRRVPARQWKRGLHKGAFDIATPQIVADVDRYGVHEIRNIRKDSLELVQNILNRTYPSYDHALQGILEGRLLSVAISHNLMLSVTNTDKAALYHTGGLIGWIDKNKVYVDKGAWLFKEEIQQVLPNVEVIKYG